MSSAAITQIAFPTLDDRQMELVGAIGELVQFADNEELILQGQKDYPFYVIKSGEVHRALNLNYAIVKSFHKMMLTGSRGVS